jgi:hypothetical protein
MSPSFLHSIVKNSSSALVFVLMFIRTEADAELRLVSHHFGIKLSLALLRSQLHVYSQSPHRRWEASLMLILICFGFKSPHH